MYKRINYLGPRKTACCLMTDSSSRPHFCDMSATSWLVSSMLLLPGCWSRLWGQTMTGASIQPQLDKLLPPTISYTTAF